MNNKYILFTLAGFIMANTAQPPDITDPTSVTKGVSTGEASPMQFLKQQLSWNRPSIYDPHQTIKLRINVAQSIHAILALATFWSMNPRILKWTTPHAWVGYFPDVDDSKPKLLLMVFLAYRFLTGEEKWPFRVIDAQKPPVQEGKEEKSKSNT